MDRGARMVGCLVGGARLLAAVVRETERLAACRAEVLMVATAGRRPDSRT